MKRIITLLSSRWFTCSLSAATAGLLLIAPGYMRLLLIAALAVHLSLSRTVTQQRVRRLGLPLAFFAVAGLLLSPPPAKALFGEDIATLLQQLAMLRQIYQVGSSAYSLEQTMQTAIRNKNLFMMQLVMQNALSIAQDHYGELRNWNQAINLGTSIPLAYQSATLGQNLNTAFFANQQIGNPNLALLARVGISDDLSQRVMSLAAQVNQQQTRNASGLQQWEQSVYSNNSVFNTQAAQQNLTNLGLVQMYEQGRSNLAINSVLAQQLMVENMQRRDETVSHLNFLQNLQAKQGQTPVVSGFDQAAQTHSLY